LARASGWRVEVLGERSETTQLFANVSRAFTLEQHLQAQRMSVAATYGCRSTPCCAGRLV
jgi:hypothetical protein